MYTDKTVWKHILANYLAIVKEILRWEIYVQVKQEHSWVADYSSMWNRHFDSMGFQLRAEWWKHLPTLLAVTAERNAFVALQLVYRNLSTLSDGRTISFQKWH